MIVPIVSFRTYYCVWHFSPHEHSIWVLYALRIFPRHPLFTYYIINHTTPLFRSYIVYTNSHTSEKNEHFWHMSKIGRHIHTHTQISYFSWTGLCRKTTKILRSAAQLAKRNQEKPGSLKCSTYSYHLNRSTARTLKCV